MHRAFLFHECTKLTYFLSISDKLKTAETDMEIQQEENSHLLGRYNKLLTDLQEKDSVHKRR